jgi:hypothetical protein
MTVPRDHLERKASTMPAEVLDRVTLAAGTSSSRTFAVHDQVVYVLDGGHDTGVIQEIRRLPVSGLRITATTGDVRRGPGTARGRRRPGRGQPAAGPRDVGRSAVPGGLPEL